MAHLVRTTTPAKEADRWRTPQAVFDDLNRQYGPFTLDAAADERNHKCDLWLGPGSVLFKAGLSDDALAIPWGHRDGSAWGSPRHLQRVFCNPPYSLTAAFVEKASREVTAGNCYSVLLLVPATTDVRWFHDILWDAGMGRPYPGVAVTFSRGRIRFERPDGSRAGQPTHGSMFVHLTRG